MSKIKEKGSLYGKLDETEKDDRELLAQLATNPSI